jgi:multicomponent Na+:H+ antiporter subunit D
MNSLASLPVVVPLVAAATVLFLNPLGGRRLIRAVTVAAVLAEIALAVALLHQAHASTIVYWFGAWKPRGGIALGISFTIDEIGAGAALLAGVVTMAAVAVLPSTTGRESPGLVHALVLTMLAGMAGFCLTGDLFNMFVFFELMAVTAFVLSAYDTRDLAALRSALNFAITNSIGAFLVLIGVAMLYGRTGALNLAQIGRQLAASPSGRVTVVAFSLLAVGFLIKAAVVPFHFWLVDTASSAPLPLVVILAGVLDALGLYGITRVYWTAFAGPLAAHAGAVRGVLVCLGALTAVAAGVMSVAIMAPRPRMAFVMVAHSGLLLIGVGCLSAQGIAGAAVYAAADGTSKAAIFLGLVLAGLAGTSDELGLPGGATSRAGWAVLIVGGLATAGLPLFGTGMGKAAVESAAAAAGYGWVTAAVVVTAALTGAAVLELGVRARRVAAVESRAGHRLAGLAVALLALSALMSTAGGWATRAAARFVDIMGYQHRVLSGAPSVRLAHGVGMALSTGGLLLNLVAVAAAAGVGVALVPGAGRGLVATLRGSGALAAARRLHSGSIGDSATWATIGTAAITLLFARTAR